jgi:hypothetical protein
MWMYGVLLRHDITLTDIRPPSIDVQPGSALTAPGRWITLRVQASGAEPLSYRWFRNGIALEDDDLYQGSATSSLTVTALTDDVVAFYFCAVENPVGTVVSETVEVAVGNASPRSPGERLTPGGAAAHRRRPMVEPGFTGSGFHGAPGIPE